MLNYSGAAGIYECYLHCFSCDGNIDQGWSRRCLVAVSQAAVMEVRDKEAGILRRIIWWQALFIMLLFSGPVIMAVAVFAV